jgi:hypothetical protein
MINYTFLHDQLVHGYIELLMPRYNQYVINMTVMIGKWLYQLIMLLS